MNIKAKSALLASLLLGSLVLGGCERIEYIEPQKSTSPPPAIQTDGSDATVLESESEATEPAIPVIQPLADPTEAVPEYNNISYIESPSGLCYNITDQKLIYGKHIDDQIYPASITKLITALVAAENLPEDFVFTVGEEIYLIQPDSSIAQLKIGQQLGMEAMLSALLIPSGNDAAYTIAVNTARYLTDDSDAGDSELAAYFVKLMNNYAKEVGAVSTQFNNPDGYHDDKHSSTTRDLLKLSLRAVENPMVKDICSKKSYSAKFASGEEATWYSHSNLITQEDNAFVGLKTGFTDEAGFCFSGYAVSNDNEYITIVLGSDTSAVRDSDTQKLFEIGENTAPLTAVLEDIVTEGEQIALD